MDEGKKQFFEQLRKQIDKLEADATCAAVVLVGVHPEADGHTGFTTCHSFTKEQMMLEVLNVYTVKRSVQLGYVDESEIIDVDAAVKH